MTKTLTEQWKDGELPVGSYYINLVGNVERVDFFRGLGWERTKDFGIEEVLAPVPSYEQFIGLMDDSKELDKAYDKINLLEKKLKIATKALKEYMTFCRHPAEEALKKMEGVK